MKSRHASIILIAAFAFILLFAQLAYAVSQYLDWYSKNTYVQNEHEPGLHFKYYGHLSILGAERYNRQGRDYPVYARITYTLDGKNYRYYLYSTGEHDIRVRKKTVTFKDTWHPFAPVTEAHGSIGLGRAKYSIQSTDPSTER